MSPTDKKNRFISIFRRFARSGLGKRGLRASEAAARIRGASRDARTREELTALYETVRFLRVSGREDVLYALKRVYLTPKGYHIAKSDISMRVVRCADELHCDERTVYRYLSYAMRIYERYLII